MSQILPNKKKRKRRFFSSRGNINAVFLVLIVAFGAVLGGILLVTFPHYPTLLPKYATLGPICCDSGNGTNCHPIVDTTHPVLTYKGASYGLLKSNVVLKEGGCHLTDSGQVYTVNNTPYPIIINSTEHIQGECGGGTGQLDQIWNPDPRNSSCVPIPDDEIVYTCVKKLFCGVA